MLDLVASQSHVAWREWTINLPLAKMDVALCFAAERVSFDTPFPYHAEHCPGVSCYRLRFVPAEETTIMLLYRTEHVTAICISEPTNPTARARAAVVLQYMAAKLARAHGRVLEYQQLENDPAVA